MGGGAPPGVVHESTLTVLLCHTLACITVGTEKVGTLTST